LSTGDNKNHPAAYKQTSSEPKRNCWKVIKDRLGQATRNGIIWSRRKIKKALDALNYVSPLLTVLATVGLVWVAYWQWDAMEKTDQTTREVNRAFVRGKELNIKKELLNWFFTPIVENTGNTQTKNLEVFVDSIFDLNDVSMPIPPRRQTPIYAPPDPQDIYRQKRKEIAEGTTFTRLTLGAKSAIPVGGVGPTMSQIDAMAKNDADGYVFGVIWYNDIFLRSRQHMAEFCFVVQPVKRGNEPVTISYGFCRYWNCTGRDECAENKKQYDKEARTLVQKQIPGMPQH
jgi:hypothetical protein